ncbi:MMPL family transporter [Methylocystis heyeri]|uniref:MMPL family transporter n=1 Tax=Methylocystis heyeri TaxID=391905 RepID=A0A6B8KC45_9HYPH|nr:MMPL family transporter [Methylocystis heyeri]QGM44605.1 MMPL family transporter [Methylocystis heyeri]
MLEKIVGFCLRWPKTIVLLFLVLTGAGAYFTSARFAIDTDTEHLFSIKIPWRHNEAELYKAFPQLNDLLIAVIDADTPENAENSAKRLNDALQGAPLISRSWRPDDNRFFRTNGLLFLGVDDLQHKMGMLIGQRDILLPLAEDPTLRGLTAALTANYKQVERNPRALAMYSSALDEFSTAFENALVGEPARVSWDKLLAGGKPETLAEDAPSVRRIVLVKPVLDFSALEPAQDAIALVRATAAKLDLDPAHGVKLRLTGQAALADDEFATISENMGSNLTITLVIVTFILFLALRSPKLILAVLATLLAGLAITAGLGIILIGRFNLISVAFAALFIGLGVDFGIQFATRYREERHKGGDLDLALVNATREIGGSLTLAAVSLLAGFFCFLPTEFLGVAELGLIAGFGMIIAYVATLTFLPALIKLLQPRAEQLPLQTASLASIDHWIARHRALVIAAAVTTALAGAPFLMHLAFDSNPMDLRNQRVESVATFIDLSKDPKTAINTVEILAPSLQAADGLASKLSQLPEVDRVTTVESFIPKDQDEKLPVIEDAAQELSGVVDPKVKPAPTDEATVKALTQAAASLRRLGGRNIPPSVVRFADAVEALADSDPTIRENARIAAFGDFHQMLGQLREALQARRVTFENLPVEITQDWVSANGQFRVEAAPKGDSNDREVLTRFAEAVEKIAPNASGAPIGISEAGKSIVRAFIQAGAYAFAAIFIILAVALRKATDVALTLGPLVLAGVVSLEAADALGLSLNFANIIALPLMFGVGVAFHIYYVIAWRKGIVDMLASSLTRAIFFSSLTTGTAFGSLYFSSHPGTASMGELLAISLFFTLLAAFIVVPAFLGPPPKRQTTGEGSAL